ncbi:hypothetical protein [Pelagibaculum spongiae]|uniref:ASP external chaperone domain-containing protein n=1 Tax=Pelagibaculum spongiae TaxID=2080658 RepID=A0A2V1GXN6_9GAMM|nr:hypothetical protein [Pelagibaculum spongiae]PVZ70403.1 hypothetical protein DC094_07365 [Pelagibaculum spongiae]
MKRLTFIGITIVQLFNMGCASAQATVDDHKANMPTYHMQDNSLYQQKNGGSEQVHGLFKGQQILLPNQPNIATITGDLIVRLHRDVSEQVILQDSRLSIKARVAPGIFIVATEPGSDLQQLIEALKVTAGVNSVEPDMILPRVQPMSY